MFARKLGTNSEEFARQAEEEAKNFENLWEVHVRRRVLIKILDNWAEIEGDNASVEVNHQHYRPPFSSLFDYSALDLVNGVVDLFFNKL